MCWFLYPATLLKVFNIFPSLLVGCFKDGLVSPVNMANFIFFLFIRLILLSRPTDLFEKDQSYKIEKIATLTVMQ